MTTLETAILDNRVTGTSAEEKLVSLKSDGTPIENHESQTVAAIVKATSIDEARLVIGTVKAVAAQDPLTDSFYIKLCSRGQDWADPDWQEQIPQLAAIGSWSEELTTKLQEMGIKSQTIWQNVGLDAEPTLEQVTAAMAKNAVAEWWAQVQFELVPQMITAGNSIEEIKAALAGS